MMMNYNSYSHFGVKENVFYVKLTTMLRVGAFYSLTPQANMGTHILFAGLVETT